MRILYITYEKPLGTGGNGGQIRQYQILKRLSKKHHFHYVGTYFTKEEERMLNDLFEHVIAPRAPKLIWHLISIAHRLIRFDYPNFVRIFEGLRVILNNQMRDLCRNGQYDIIQVEHTNIAHWLNSICPSIPKILVAHNIKKELWYKYSQNTSGFHKFKYYLDSRRFHYYESRNIRSYQAVVAMSEADKEKIVQIVGQEIVVPVVPNGVDLEYFKPVNECGQPGGIVFTGTMNHPPNHEGIMFFLNDIFPKIIEKVPSIKITIVGNSPKQQLLSVIDNRFVTVTGFVDDIRPYLASASIVVVPLLSGSGTRLKILEAMAMGKAIVSTSIGAEGITYTHEKNILIANDPGEFAKTVIDLLNNPTQRYHLGMEARDLVERQYSWDRIADQMDKVYHSLIGTK